MSTAGALPPAGAAKALARRRLGEALPGLVALSHDLHGHPETAFEEHRSAAAVGAALASAGFALEAGAYGLATAFEAVAGDGGLLVVLCAEYDALPGIGHACGHNVIAAASVGAALALQHLAGALRITVKVLGTPAEERGGGKVLLLERGAFAGACAAMMVHPAPADSLELSCRALRELEVVLSAPTGAETDDAVTVAESAIGLLRQHLPPGEMVHGFFAPRQRRLAVRRGSYQLRAGRIEHLDALERRLVACVSAGAAACGAELAVSAPAPAYGELSSDAELLARYGENAAGLGRRFLDLGPAVFSTDMGNVSRALPAIHPAIGLGCYPATNHTPAFAVASASPAADRAVRDGALALAYTVIDAAVQPALRERLVEGARGRR